MVIKSLTLTNFRNHRQQKFDFKDVNIVTGPNAGGKTSVLEALYLLSGKNSLKVEKISDLVNWDESFARAQLTLTNGTLLEIFVDKSNHLGRLTYKVNTSHKLKKEFKKNLATVLFSHEDLNLLEGSPAKRRQFIDNSLCFNNHYSQIISEYSGLIRSRNRLLEQIREGLEKVSTLTVWNERLISQAFTIEEIRQEYFAFLGANLPLILANFGRLFPKGACKVQYHAKIVTPQWLSEARDREIASGQTLHGPHRADFSIWCGSRNQGVFASRGQQRALIISLKTAEAAFVEKKTGNRAAVLLDDVFSELDNHTQKAIWQLLPENQIFITTTLPLKADNWDKNMCPDRQPAFFELSPHTG